MKIFNPLLKSINNYRDGYHLASKHWQDYKKTLPLLSSFLKQVLVGIVLGDASMYIVSKEAHVKFEQGYLQEPFLVHLFHLFKLYCFILKPGTRIDKNSNRKGSIKSYWFKTFSHLSFTTVYLLFYIDGIKQIVPGLVLNHVTDVSLAYWIICDGSLNGNTILLNTQGFTHSENLLLSSELNQKFNLHSKVIPHKNKYWVIKIPSKDRSHLRRLITPYMIPSIRYKIPKG